MRYNESKLDQQLRKWFINDFSRSLLREIDLSYGKLRGVGPFQLDIGFPIIAIAGKNGAGKSTLLAMACCAYHNEKGGFRLPRRRNSYYTFKDFFVQHTGEQSPQGVEIHYGFAADDMEDSPDFPGGKGIGYQRRWKSDGGKWNDYDSREHKPVVFLGIERIVPHSERSQSRSYSKSFSSLKTKGWETKVKEIVGSILGKKYDDFKMLEHSKYSLPVVAVGDALYSGFNMGAGENALFEIFSTIYSCGSAALIVLDEIELGLHSEAQLRFMKALKETCLERKTQVICTTHSKEIFDSLPDDARFFIEQVNGKTRLTAGISSDFAMSKLGAASSKELEIYVEDDVAHAIVSSALAATTRTRVSIKRIGSASAMARQLAAAYVRKENRPTLAAFDGDQRALESNNINHAKAMAEDPKADFEPWIRERFCYLPGDSWPEAWLVQKAIEIVAPISAALGADEDEMTSYLQYGLQAGKHNEFFEIARHVGLDRDQCLATIASLVCGSFYPELQDLRERILEVVGN